MAPVFEELPLFLLNTVLFPYAYVRLHVRETKYLQLIQTCSEKDRPFGIVLIRSERKCGEPEPYLVGTAVQIQRVVTFEDGTLDVDVQGVGRFRIRDLDETRIYPVGFTEPLCEIDDSVRDSQLSDQARELFVRWAEIEFADEQSKVEVLLPDDPEVLSFSIASFLEMENIEKQHLLELTETDERFRKLIEILELQIQVKRPRENQKISLHEIRDQFSPN